MAFATIDVTKGITGTIPVANGGTGLTSGTSGQFLKFTGSTTVASSALSGVGKVLQVKTKYLATSVATTSGTITSILTSDTITLSSSSNSLYIIASVNYDLQGYSATIDPAAQFYLYDQAGNNLANVNIERQMTNNADGTESTCVLQGFYSPPDTSETVDLRYKCDNGQIRARGSNNYNNATCLTVMEISA
jgi:hypothetical protein